jgi:hypothetical protein
MKRRPGIPDAGAFACSGYFSARYRQFCDERRVLPGNACHNGQMGACAGPFHLQGM